AGGRKMNEGFTGTRRGLTDAQKKALRVVLCQEAGTLGVVHHGDCVGADAFCHSLAVDLGNKVVIHPPDRISLRAFCQGAWQVHAPCPYLDRNRDIVAATDVLLACPGGVAEERRSGTWATVRYARRLGRPVVLILPDGTVRRSALKEEE